MNIKRLIGIVWLIFSIRYLYRGFDYIYAYSTPGTIWLAMVPVTIAYTKIVSGILCIIIGTNFLKKSPKKEFLVIPLTFSLLIYLIIDIVKYKTEPYVSYGENVLLLILIFISLALLKNSIGIPMLTKQLNDNKKIIVLILLNVLIPYFLSELIGYDFYEFLH